MFAAMPTPNLRRRRGRPRMSDDREPCPNRHQKADNYSLKQHVLVITGTVAAFAIFYLTPVSEFVTTTVLLPLVPLEADYEMGRQALRELQYTEVYRFDWSPLLQSVSQDLIQTYRQQNKQQKYVWDVAIIRSKAINAFALPGGIIRVTDALLDAIQPTRGELAALVGHEMGHVIHRHSQARVLQSKIVSWILQALIYDDKDEEEETFGQALGELLAKSAVWLGQQRFSRLDEYQADASSWELLVEASQKYGYNPQSLRSLLEKLWKMEKGQPTNDPNVLNVIENWSRTHPATKDRLDALQFKWEALPRNEKRRLRHYQV